MDKEEFAKKMTGYDGLDRGGDIRTTVDEDGNVFMFSENQYGCPVIDVLVEGQDKMTLYYMTRPGTAKIDERTNRVYEPEDEEMALRYGRLFHNVSTTDKKAEDLMVLKIAKGIEVHDEGFVGGADSIRFHQTFDKALLCGIRLKRQAPEKRQLVGFQFPTFYQDLDGILPVGITSVEQLRYLQSLLRLCPKAAEAKTNHE